MPSTACPKCQVGEFTRSHRKSKLDYLAGAVGLLPYCCLSCGRRFRRFRFNWIIPRGPRRRQSELLLYGFFLLVFGAFLYYLTRSP